MQKDPPVRKSNRLQGYDYAQAGYYFVTICVKDNRKLLGDIVANSNPPCINLSEIGLMVEAAINAIPTHYPQIMVDKYVIMPNHVHMILVVQTGTDGRLLIASTSISAVVKQLKSRVSKQAGFAVWQRSFHDHVIRDDIGYRRIWQYIEDNPAKWAEDRYYVQ